MVKHGKDDDFGAKPGSQAGSADERAVSNVLPFPEAKSDSAAAEAPKPRRVPGSGPPREAPPAPSPLDDALTRRLRERFGSAIRDAVLDRQQSIVVVEPSSVLEITRALRDDEKFEMLVDLTAVDWPRREKRFDVVWNLYSLAQNERVRLKAHVAFGESVSSVSSVWPAADWPERECFDLFGIVFDGHPNLRRILLPDEWHGHPLRKDYDILMQDTEWVRKNLGIESGQ